MVCLMTNLFHRAAGISRGVALAFGAVSLVACRQKNGVASAPAPVAAHVQGGPVCARTVPLIGSPDAVFRTAMAAARSLGLILTALDTTEFRLVVGGARAPRASGSALLSEVRLGFTFVLLPPDAAASWRMMLEPTVSTWPYPRGGGTPADNKELARQAGGLAGRFVRQFSPTDFGYICSRDEG